MAKAIMIQGTCSNAGKSFLVAALCRIFKQDGYSVAPFKAQNMALNSFITEDGLEMGRAQVMQAEAAGIKPTIQMNPILLKPCSDTGSQVIVNGEVVGTMLGAEYYRRKPSFVPMVQAAYVSLASQYDIIVLEGAGSPAEINLQENDLVNMGMSRMANAPVLLVGDIDRGGVFASLAGTLLLLEPEERARVKGLVINKFRGDRAILAPGLEMLEGIVQKSVLGVVPMLHVDVEDEDSLSERLERKTIGKLIDIAIVRLPHLSNFTDFNPLETVEGVSVRYVDTITTLGNPDLVILPGTKNTMGDLLWLRQTGLETLICKHAARGGAVLGICGGYQMLGERLDDPYQVEHGGSVRGIGLLPVSTVFAPQKIRTRVRGCVLEQQGIFAPLSGVSVEGYEIHMGRTQGAHAFSSISNIEGNETATQEGAVAGNICGTYLHGLFDQAEVTQALLVGLCQAKEIDPTLLMVPDWKDYKQNQYDLLADGVRKSLDMQQIYRILEEGV